MTAAEDFLAAVRLEAATLGVLAALAEAEAEMRTRLAGQYDVEYLALTMSLDEALRLVRTVSPNSEWIEVLSAEPGLVRLNVYNAKAPTGQPHADIAPMVATARQMRDEEWRRRGA